MAAAVLSVLSAADKNRILRAMGAALRENASYLREENARDVAAAAEKGLSAAMIDRLTLRRRPLRRWPRDATRWRPSTIPWAR